jgi:hypothetical protein
MKRRCVPPMQVTVQIRRLIAATLVCASVVLGVSFLMGSGKASPRASAAHTCSAADKQFLTTVSSNMTQLSYWSDSLSSGDATAALVIKQSNGFSYELLAFHLADSHSYRAFCRIGFAAKPPRKSTLQRNLKRIRPETLERINRAIIRHAQRAYETQRTTLHR